MHSCARIVLLEVFHQDNATARVPTYAVLDDQSTDVFIMDKLLRNKLIGCSESQWSEHLGHKQSTEAH